MDASPAEFLMQFVNRHVGAQGYKFADQVLMIGQRVGLLAPSGQVPPGTPQTSSERRAALA